MAFFVFSHLICFPDPFHSTSHSTTLHLYEALNAPASPPPCLVDSANIDSESQGAAEGRKNETSFAVVVLDYSL